MSSGSENIPNLDFSPSENLAQSLGNDGTDGRDKLCWRELVADGLNDGEGNKISMTEAITLLLQLKARQG